MKDRNIYIGGAIIIALIIGIWAWNRGEVPQAQEPAEQQVTMFENVNREKLGVIFNEEEKTVLIDGTVLTQVESASGARYVNAEEGLEFWNKGVEVTFSKGETVLFQGRTVSDTQVDDLLYVFAGPTWVWQSARMSDGTVTAPRQPGKYTITFDSAEGRLIGVTDCNGFGGAYTSGAGNTLSFGPFMSTLMYCEGSQEAEFSNLVTSSYRYIFSESGDLVLILEDEAGAIIFTRQ